jgi:tetratricopeptide (TPR) repeat protein
MLSCSKIGHGVPFVFSDLNTKLLWAALLTAIGATGCASAPGVYGNSARYSPAFHGYVMAENDGSDDPSVEATVLLLRDPLTGSKLSCRDEVLEWRELYEDVADDAVQDANAATATLITATAAFAPLVAMEPVGALVLAESMLASGWMFDELRSENATELLARGIVLYRRKRFAQAATVIERALAKDGTVGILDKAYLYLGLSYSELGNDKRARVALAQFKERSAVRDVQAYREADSALNKLGGASSRCSSTEPVDLHW